MEQPMSFEHSVLAGEHLAALEEIKRLEAERDSLRAQLGVLIAEKAQKQLCIDDLRRQLAEAQRHECPADVGVTANCAACEARRVPEDAALDAIESNLRSCCACESGDDVFPTDVCNWCKVASAITSLRRRVGELARVFEAARDAIDEKVGGWSNPTSAGWNRLIAQVDAARAKEES